MIVALALLLLAPGETFPDPIGPAAEGKLQCYGPDPVRRTCSALAGYRSDGKGGFLNDAEVLISHRTGLVMRTVEPVIVREGAVCGQITRAAHEKAEFLVNGQPLAGEGAKQARATLAQLDAPLFDREICTRYPPEDDHLVAKATLAGKADAFPDQKVIWVSPAEGYRVAP